MKICSVSNREHTYFGPYGSYVIPACAQGQEYSSVLVRPHRNQIAEGTLPDGRQKHRIDLVKARDVAFDIVYGIRSPQNPSGPQLTPEEINMLPANERPYEGPLPVTEMSRRGVFVPLNGETPTPEELLHARELLHHFRTQLVENADATWRETGNVKDIDREAKTAAEILKLTKPWLSMQGAEATADMVECPACGTSIKPGKVVCWKCNAILNPELARQYFPDRYAAAAPSQQQPVAGKLPVGKL